MCVGQNGRKGHKKGRRPQINIKDMEFYHQFPDKPSNGSYQRFRKPSMTEPDNTMTIPEIIARYTRGQGAGVQLRPWQTGVAQEEGEGPQQDSTVEQVLDLVPAEPQPAAEPAASPATAGEPAAEPAAPAPAPAPAGA